mmetsp:Transcript_1236/g.2001  ORF Transcript_1236/g.2001 Transcript_1236/m.2001 type:complete len:81 (-) Transcript_1236:380-622(-)
MNSPATSFTFCMYDINLQLVHPSNIPSSFEIASDADSDAQSSTISISKMQSQTTVETHITSQSRRAASFIPLIDHQFRKI